MFQRIGAMRRLIVAALFLLAVSVGYMAGEVHANGWCQWCDTGTPKAACPASNSMDGWCDPLADPCFANNKCEAEGASTGTCRFIWISSCYARNCPTGACDDGSGACRCSNPGSGC